MRIFRTCRVMDISTVAVYTHVDRGALHVRYAEEAYCISNSPEDTSYLKPELILAIAKKTGAAIHPGYGFLSENADFARRCEEEGVIFMKKSNLNPAAYGLTVDEATRLVRLHDMCAGMTPEDFDQMETAARSIQLVNSLKKLDSRPGGAA